MSRRGKPPIVALLCVLALPATGQAADINIKPGRASLPSVPSNFLGISWETWHVPALTGRPKSQTTPAVQLVRNLSSGGPISFRIGGGSQDVSWWAPDPAKLPRSLRADRVYDPIALANTPGAGGIARGTKYFMTGPWLQGVKNFMSQTGARGIFGMNLLSGAKHPNNLKSFTEAILRAIPSRQIDAFELGNEPDLYWMFYPRYWYLTDSKVWWPSSQKLWYPMEDLVRDYHTVARALPRSAAGRLAGAGFAGTTVGRWAGDDQKLRLLYGQKLPGRLRISTQHAYAIATYDRDRDHPNTWVPIGKLLSDEYSPGFARRANIIHQNRLAHRYGLQYRIGEFNTTAAGGRAGWSDRFASALWAASAMRSLARIRIAGVNVHFGNHTSYIPFWINWDAKTGKPRAEVHPIYYGMYFFSQTIGRGSREVRMSMGGQPPGVDAWLTRRGGEYRLALINRSRRANRVFLRMPARFQNPGKLYRLTAPSPRSPDRVSWAGQRFDSTGNLTGRERVEKIPSRRGTYGVRLPAYSAALLKII